jgi:16S rRNA (guanine966-N2)-methyltransferase
VTRIVAGSAGGRRLVTPAGPATRPTSERAREGLFSTLASLCGDLNGLAFLDLFAGSGAVGLEAASRAARLVTLVERDPAALRALWSNVETLALPAAEVRAAAVERLLATAPPDEYDIAFLDPPYAEPVEDVLTVLVGRGWLAADAVVVVERASRGPGPVWPAGLEALRERRYGTGTLWYGRRS